MQPKFLVSVIAYTQPEWSRLISLFKEINGESPTRELDKKGIQVGDPGSYAMTLERINNRTEAVGNLQKGYRSLDFVDFTFLIGMDDSDYLQKLCNIIDATHLQYTGKHGTGYVVLKGSVKQLRELIVVGSQIEEYRPLFNRMYDCLCTYGFKTAFGMKQVQNDGTFLLS